MGRAKHDPERHQPAAATTTAQGAPTLGLNLESRRQRLLLLQQINLGNPMGNPRAAAGGDTRSSPPFHFGAGAAAGGVTRSFSSSFLSGTGAGAGGDPIPSFSSWSSSYSSSSTRTGPHRGGIPVRSRCIDRRRRRRSILPHAVRRCHHAKWRYGSCCRHGECYYSHHQPGDMAGAKAHAIISVGSGDGIHTRWGHGPCRAGFLPRIFQSNQDDPPRH